MRARKLVGTLLLGLALLLLVTVGLPAYVSHVVFQPAPLAPARTSPVEWGLAGAEEVWFEAADGVRLHGWWVSGPDPPCGAAVYFHGNAGNLASRRHVARRIASLGLDVFLFDYRGYGASEGSPDEAGLYRDGRAAYRHARARSGLTPGRVLLVGHSLGAAVAVDAATARTPGGLVLTAPFESLADAARALYGPLGGWVVARAKLRFDAGSRIGKVDAPVLVARGTEDRIVPHATARRLHRRASEPAEWLSLPGRGHNDLWGDDLLWNRLRTFVDATACSPGPAERPSREEGRAAPASPPGRVAVFPGRSRAEPPERDPHGITDPRPRAAPHACVLRRPGPRGDDVENRVERPCTTLWKTDGPRRGARGRGSVWIPGPFSPSSPHAPARPRTPELCPLTPRHASAFPPLHAPYYCYGQLYIIPQSQPGAGKSPSLPPANRAPSARARHVGSDDARQTTARGLR